MDWATIITAISAVAGGEFLFRMIDRIAFRKEEKNIKKNEEKSSTADVEEKEINNDKAQIDLGKEFMQSTLEMTQKMQDMIMSSNKERDEYWLKQEDGMKDIKNSIDGLTVQVDYVSGEIRDISEYLNGGYKEFKKTHNGSRNAKKRYAAAPVQ